LGCGRSCPGLDAAFGAVLYEGLVEDALHLLEGLKPGAASLDAKILVEEGAEYYWIAAD